MADSTAARLRKVRKLAGPGVPGAEHDTPLYHVDISKKDADKLVADPIGVLERLGVGPEEGIAPDGTMSVTLGLPDQAWTGGGWTDVDAPSATSTWCCYVVGDTTTCHQH
jgi:hypothetical protein